MFTELEKQLLILLKDRGLVRKSELSTIFPNSNGAAVNVVRALADRGFVQIVAPLGEDTFAITKIGGRVLEEKG